jgi:hypothetical protein
MVRLQWAYCIFIMHRTPLPLRYRVTPSQAPYEAFYQTHVEERTSPIPSRFQSKMNSSTIRRSIIGLTGSLVRHQRVIRSAPVSAAQDPQAGPSGSKTVTEEAPANPLFNHSREQTDEDKPQWLIHKEALRRKFPDGWNPPKKISRPSMTLLRTLHQTDPHQFSLSTLSEKFKISPEAVRRILRSKWEPTQETVKKTQQRQQTLGAAHSSDGWVHHEKLETDQIPLNLAHTLQSSLPSSSKISSSSSLTRKSQSRSSYNHFKK